MASVLPAPDEAAAVTLDKDSLVWKRSSDPRLLGAAGTALLLQVAHPTVSAGVADHSVFQSDPWGRLVRTLDYTYLSVYGGDAAAPVLARVRDLHKRIRGTHKGKRYHALDPEAFAWVHLSLGHTVVEAHRHFGMTLTAGEEDVFYREWRGIGRLLGLRDRDMPESAPGALADYVADVVERRLQATETTQAVLDLLAAPPRPPVLPAVCEPAWRIARLASGPALWVMSVGMLPAVLRDRLEVRFGAVEKAQFALLSASSKALNPAMAAAPAVGVTGPAWLRLRSAAIGRSEFSPQPTSATRNQTADVKSTAAATDLRV